MNYLFLLLGLLTLIISGDFLVKGAVGIAKKFHISSLVIGMTVISFGTSAPELIVSIKAALSGNSGIAIGSVIGSNIANLALVLGLTLLIFPIAVDRNSKIINWPMMMVASILFFAFSYDGIIKFWEGAVLFSIVVAFTTYLIRSSRKKNKTINVSSRAVGNVDGDGKVKDLKIVDMDVVAEPKENKQKFGKSMLFLGLGLIGLYFGADWLLKGAVNIARDFGMEERVIGVTIIAFGTSVPELVASCVAAFRKETDMALGNLIGSNIFNIMTVIGITAMIEPMSVSENAISIDMMWMLGISFIILPMMLIGKKLNRWNGIILFGTYVTYIGLLIFNI